MTRSFRFQLSIRFALTMALGCAAVSVLAYVAIRQLLDHELNSTLLNIASFQAASVTGAPGGQMEFHEWELTPAEAASIRDLNRYAQVWTLEGESLLRTRYITEDLPLDTLALREAAAGEMVWREQVFQAFPIRSLFYPLERMGPAHARHVLQVAAPLEARNRLLRNLALLLTMIVLVSGFSTFLGSWWLASNAIRPVTEVIDQAEAIEPGGRRHRIEAYADTREYRRLVDVLNGMLSRLDDAFETQRRFTADASHELRSPLTALRGELELARRRERSPDEYRRVIVSALEEVERLSRVAEDLLMLARTDSGTMQPRLRRADLAEITRRAAEHLQAQAAAKEIALNVETGKSLTAYLDPDLISRVVWNLVDNALKFTPRGGRVDIHLSASGEIALLEVLDTGPGLPAEQLERLFERFYRGDPSRTAAGDGPGTGLGLAIVRSIVELHGGRVTAANREGGGVAFRVELPQAGGAPVTGWPASSGQRTETAV